MGKRLFLIEIERKEKDTDGEEVDRTYFYSFVAENLEDARVVAKRLYPWTHKKLVEIGE
jgi:hypothetical protein